MTLRSLLCILVAVSAFPPRMPAQAPPRGKALHDALATSILKTEGTTSLRWLPDGRGYLEKQRDPETGLTTFWRVDPLTEEKTPLFDAAAISILQSAFDLSDDQTPLGGLPFDDFDFLPGGRAIRFAAGENEAIYDLESRDIRLLRRPEVDTPTASGPTASLKLSPDFGQFAFVKDHDNLFLWDTSTGEHRRLTRGASEDNTIGFLGAGDWYVWSPDGKRLAYLSADIAELPRVPIQSDTDRDAEHELLRYPFVTEPDAKLTLAVIDIESGASVEIERGSVETPYIRDLRWLPDSSELTYQLVNRWQNRLKLKAADPDSGDARTLLVEEEPSFLEPPTNFEVLEDRRQFIWTSRASGFRQLYLYDIEGQLVRQLTRGQSDVGSLLLADETNGWIYFEAYPNHGMDRHLYRVRLDGSKQTRLTAAGFHTVSIDPAGRYYTDDFSSLDAPRRVNLHRSDGTLIRRLASTSVERVEEYGLSAPELISVKAADGETNLYGLLFKPADFDPAQQYPLLVVVYGGPHSKEIANRYQTADYRARFAQLGFLVWQVDARGTPWRGRDFQSAHYMRMGQVEVDDQAAAVRQLAERPYIDATRVGVTGISHGGYMTLMMMLRHPDVFHVGVARAPITDLANGPKQYIARIMRTPQANPDGYHAANPLEYVDDLRGKLLLVHGTADRNALKVNTLQLAEAMIRASKPFEMMIYPRGVHVFGGRNARHEYKTGLGYFLPHLKPEGWQESLETLW